jgi:hypothetical protein
MADLAGRYGRGAAMLAGGFGGDETSVAKDRDDVGRVDLGGDPHERRTEAPLYE